MSIASVGAKTSLIVQSLVDLRSQLDQLQQQLGTGKKSDTYAGMGIDRGLAVGLRNHMVALGGYDDAITNVNVRLNLAQTALGRIADVSSAVKAAALQTNAISSNGTTTSQSIAATEFSEVIGLLN